MRQVLKIRFMTALWITIVMEGKIPVKPLSYGAARGIMTDMRPKTWIWIPGKPQNPDIFLCNFFRTYKSEPEIFPVLFQFKREFTYGISDRQNL